MADYDQNNIFAKIIRDEIPSTKIYEDDGILAFEDINKAAPIHILVIPKGEYISFEDFTLKSGSEEVANFFKRIATIAAEQNLEDGYRLIINNGANAGQTVFHFHVHILGKKKMSHLLS